MPETSHIFFLLQGGPGGQYSGGPVGGGAVFLNSAFMVFLEIFLQTRAKIDARNLQKKVLTPKGARGRVIRGARGASFLKICILGIFGDISSNLS